MILAVAIVYFAVAVDQARKGDLAMAVVFGAYAVSNCGLAFSVK